MLNNSYLMLKLVIILQISLEKVHFNTAATAEFWNLYWYIKSTKIGHSFVILFEVKVKSMYNGHLKSKYTIVFRRAAYIRWEFLQILHKPMATVSH